MSNDWDNIVGLFVQIILTFSWLCMFGMAFWMFALWVNLINDSKKNGSFLSKIFPVFIFNPAVLSDEGRLNRNKFFKVFYLFILIVFVSVGLLLFSANLPMLDFSSAKLKG